MNGNNFEQVFNYVFSYSYNNLDEILKNTMIAEHLKKKNNNYYKKIRIETQLTKNIAKAYCFSIMYMLILTILS